LRALLAEPADFVADEIELEEMDSALESRDREVRANRVAGLDRLIVVACQRGPVVIEVDELSRSAEEVTAERHTSEMEARGEPLRRAAVRDRGPASNRLAGTGSRIFELDPDLGEQPEWLAAVGDALGTLVEEEIPCVRQEPPALVDVTNGGLSAGQKIGVLREGNPWRCGVEKGELDIGEAGRFGHRPQPLEIEIILQNAVVLHLGLRLRCPGVMGAGFTEGSDPSVDEDATHLFEHALLIDDVVEGVETEDAIDRAVAERELVPVEDDVAGRDAPGEHRMDACALFADHQPRHRDIQRDDPAAEPGEDIRGPAASRGEVENRHARSEIEAFEKNGEIHEQVRSVLDPAERLSELIGPVGEAGEVVLRLEPQIARREPLSQLGRGEVIRRHFHGLGPAAHSNRARGDFPAEISESGHREYGNRESVVDDSHGTGGQTAEKSNFIQLSQPGWCGFRTIPRPAAAVAGQRTDVLSLKKFLPTAGETGQAAPVPRMRVALLLLGSGFAALVMQTVWLREFRLIFGASTASSAAVIAIFMGGLGFGSLLIGRRVDRVANPLLVYAALELIVAVSAAATPLLVLLVRVSWISLGGMHLDPLLGTVIRLLLATAVLIIPTFCMGGSLPAAARSVETEGDVARGNLGLLYGLNAIGAVVGVAVSTFFFLELLGNRSSLWTACLINALVAAVAWMMARRVRIESSPRDLAIDETVEDQREEGAAPPERWRSRMILAAAAVVGFAFFLMEIVWYRMLSPILGGSTFTFGLILAVALAGIGAGGAAYGYGRRDRPIGFRHFAATAAFEALFIAIPLFLGDRIAVLALLLRSLEAAGFAGHVFAWTLVTTIVVFPAAFVAGIQFPVLIALLGEGRRRIGRDVGRAYLWNTIGAITGALVGGFGLLPLLSAPGAWRLVIVLLAAIAVVFSVISPAGEPRSRRAVPIALAVIAILMTLAPGPSAAWRHSGIGAGRAGTYDESPNGLRNWMNSRRGSILWETDGVEGSIAMSGSNGLAFIINGKADGNAIGDRSTQVMSGLVGSILHPDPRKALVVGLGTGSSAGWLGAVESIERVDVVELEPAIVEVARASEPVNASVLQNPKVHLFMGDAREWILTTPNRYDVIFSEPSNPYRAGIASLFTREFYESSADALSDDGIFIQWLQAYEVSADTVKSVYATMGAVFLEIQTWQTNNADLLLVASNRPIPLDVTRLRQRIASEPYASALLGGWRVVDLEGFLSHFVADSSFARAVVDATTEINRDDRNSIEFAFARTVGRRTAVSVAGLRRSAVSAGAGRAPLIKGTVEWDEVEMRRIPGGAATIETDEASAARIQAHEQFTRRNFSAVASAWREQPWTPADPTELLILAESLADGGHGEAVAHIERLRHWFPVEADMVSARLLWRIGNSERAVDALSRGFHRYRDDPWSMVDAVRRGLDLAVEIGRQEDDPRLIESLLDALREPFILYSLNEIRVLARYRLASLLEPRPCHPAMREVLHEMEPHVRWVRSILAVRAQCYEAWGDPLAVRARKDFFRFVNAESARFAVTPEAP
jgi:spermidine synthase